MFNYLYIFEDGTILHVSRGINNSDFKANEEGILEIIDMDNKKYLENCTWVDLPQEE